MKPDFKNTEENKSSTDIREDEKNKKGGLKHTFVNPFKSQPFKYKPLGAAIKSLLPLSLGIALLVLVETAIEVYLAFKMRDIMAASFDADVSLVEKLSVLLIGFSVMLLFVSIISSYLKGLYIAAGSRKIKSLYLDRIFKMRPADFNSLGQSKVLAGFLTKIGIVEEQFLGSKYNVLSGVLKLAAGVIIAIRIDIYILVFAAIIALLLIIAVATINALLAKMSKQYDIDYAEYVTGIKEKLSLYRTAKFWNLFSRFRDEHRKSTIKVENSYIRMMRINLVVNIILAPISSVLMFGFVIFLGNKIAQGTYTLSNMMFFFASIPILIMPGIGMLQSAARIKAGKIILEDLFDIPETDQEHGTAEFTGFKDCLSLKNISFSYGETEVFRNFNLEIKRGEKVLVMGPSGSGKSTLLKLLRRFTGPNSGEIILDGRDFADYTDKSLYSKISYLEQNVFLFEDSLKNNITMFTDYKDQEIEGAVRAANLDKMVAAKNEGLDLILKDGGTNLSGGEITRVALARALIKDAQLLLLDEPFAALDKQTRDELEKEILQLENVTVVNVTHITNDDFKKLYDKVVTLK